MSRECGLIWGNKRFIWYVSEPLPLLMWSGLSACIDSSVGRLSCWSYRIAARRMGSSPLLCKIRYACCEGGFLVYIRIVIEEARQVPKFVKYWCLCAHREGIEWEWSVDPLILKLGTKWRWQIGFTHRLLYPRRTTSRCLFKRKLAGAQNSFDIFKNTYISCRLQESNKDSSEVQAVAYFYKFYVIHPVVYT